jgi:hypothetical protein
MVDIAVQGEVHREDELGHGAKANAAKTFT